MQSSRPLAALVVSVAHLDIIKVAQAAQVVHALDIQMQYSSLVNAGKGLGSCQDDLALLFGSQLQEQHQC